MYCGLIQYDVTAASDIFNFTMYADDTTLSTSINCSENNNNCDLINSELSKINEWLIINKLSKKNYVQKPSTCYFICHKKKLSPQLKEIGTIKRFYSVYDVYYGLLHVIQPSVITKCGFIPEKRS